MTEVHVDILAPFVSGLRPGDGVIDIGANVGVVTTRCARCVGPSGHVLAVEPHAATVERLRREVAAYPWVEVRQLAVGSVCGTAAMTVGADTRTNSLAPANVPRPTTSETVAVATLDALAATVRRLRGIKIDAQGMECAILRGAPATLQLPDLLWCVEVWPDGLAACGGSVDELVDAFASAGWQIAATGKNLERRAVTWEDFLARSTRMVGSKHTNLLVTRG